MAAPTVIATSLLGLRYADYVGKFGCLTKRFNCFELALRRVDTDEDGVQASERLDVLHSVLNSILTVAKPAGD